MSILKILSLSHSSSFSAAVRLFGWSFPFINLSVKRARSNSSSIRLLKFRITWGNVVESAIPWMFSKCALTLWRRQINSEHNIALRLHSTPTKMKRRQCTFLFRKKTKRLKRENLNWDLMSSSFLLSSASSLSRSERRRLCPSYSLNKRYPLPITPSVTYTFLLCLLQNSLFQ